MVERRRAHRRGPRDQRGRLAHHPRRRAAAPHLAGRAAQPGQRAARRDVADRPAADAPGPGRAVHRAPARRLAVKPGITGWAQVNGRASLPWSERIELDLYYIEHRSLALDLRILRRSAAMVLDRVGPLQGRDRRLGGPDCEPAGGAADRRRQALRHRQLLRAADARRSSPTPRRSRPPSTPRTCARRCR